MSLKDPAGGELQRQTPSTSPELLVNRGQSVGVSGQGSYPNSFVQLWLPGVGNGGQEIGRLPVRPDGTFDAELAFTPSQTGMPLPIGRQVIQVVGYDSQGRQTVVDMTINIGQGVPAPEAIRQTGLLPELGAGQSLATSGGAPETVTVTGLPDSRSVSVEGSGWMISVRAERDGEVVGTSDGSSLIRLNQSAVGSAAGTGFLPGTLATVWVFSDPTLVSTVTVNEDGEFTSEFLIDSRLIEPGEHTLQIQGVGQDGFVKAANLGIVVDEPVVVSSEGASGFLLWIVSIALLTLLAVLLIIWRIRARRA
jgi:hypothetical protein